MHGNTYPVQEHIKTSNTMERIQRGGYRYVFSLQEVLNMLFFILFWPRVGIGKRNRNWHLKGDNAYIPLVM